MLLSENQSNFIKRVNELTTTILAIKSGYANEQSSSVGYVLDIEVLLKSIRLVWERFLSSESSLDFYKMLEKLAKSIQSNAQMSVALCRGDAKYAQDIQYVLKKTELLEQALRKLNQQESDRQLRLF